IDEAHVGIVPVDVRQLRERTKRQPIAVLVSGRSTVDAARSRDETRTPGPSDVLKRVHTDVPDRRHRTHDLGRREPPLAEVALVAPRLGAPAEPPAQPFSIEVDP